jgi:hypothetical protein
MTESEYIEKIVAAFQQVPPKNLLIIELANKYIVDGAIDEVGLSEVQPEVNLAIAEAKMYGSYTLIAVSSLMQIEAQAADVGP